MAAVNANWHRWTHASVAKHIHDAATTAGLPMVVELLDTRSTAWMESPHKAEATIIGPSSKGIGGVHRIDVSVFVVVSSHKQVADAYKHLDFVGALANALDKCILVKELPAATEVGELLPTTDAAQRVAVTNVRSTELDNLVHTVVEVDYSGLWEV